MKNIFRENWKNIKSDWISTLISTDWKTTKFNYWREYIMVGVFDRQKLFYITIDVI